MERTRTGKRIIRQPTPQEREAYREALFEEEAGVEDNKQIARDALKERRELADVVAELKAIRERLGISLTELASRTGMTVGNLSRLENMDGPNPTIETLRRYAQAIRHRIEIAIVAQAG